jgi:hypothetical protein
MELVARPGIRELLARLKVGRQVGGRVVIEHQVPLFLGQLGDMLLDQLHDKVRSEIGRMQDVSLSPSHPQLGLEMLVGNVPADDLLDIHEGDALGQTD